MILGASAASSTALALTSPAPASGLNANPLVRCRGARGTFRPSCSGHDGDRARISGRHRNATSPCAWVTFFRAGSGLSGAVPPRLAELVIRGPSAERELLGGRARRGRDRLRRPHAGALRLRIGSRLPAAATSMGHVLCTGAGSHGQAPGLASRPARDRRSRAGARTRYRGPAGLCAGRPGTRNRIALDRSPDHRRCRRTVPALNIGTHAARVTIDRLRREFLPPQALRRNGSAKRSASGRNDEGARVTITRRSATITRHAAQVSRHSATLAERWTVAESESSSGLFIRRTNGTLRWTSPLRGVPFLACFGASASRIPSAIGASDLKDTRNR